MLRATRASNTVKEKDELSLSRTRRRIKIIGRVFLPNSNVSQNRHFHFSILGFLLLDGSIDKVTFTLAPSKPETTFYGMSSQSCCQVKRKGPPYGVGIWPQWRFIPWQHLEVFLLHLSFPVKLNWLIQDFLRVEIGTKMTRDAMIRRHSVRNCWQIVQAALFRPANDPGPQTIPGPEMMSRMIPQK